MGRYFDYRQLKDFDVSWVVETVKVMENDAHLILEGHQQSKAKYDFVPVETHQLLCFLGMRNAG